MAPPGPFLFSGNAGLPCQNSQKIFQGKGTGQQIVKLLGGKLELGCHAFAGFGWYGFTTLRYGDSGNLFAIMFKPAVTFLAAAKDNAKLVFTNAFRLLGTEISVAHFFSWPCGWLRPLNDIQAANPKIS